MIEKLGPLAQSIYSRLADTQSKDIFQNRLMYSLTNDYRYIMKIVNTIPQSQKLSELFSSIIKIPSKLILYGAGSEFIRIKEAFPQINFNCLCDKNVEKQKNGWQGYQVISPQTLLSSYKNSYVMIVSSKYWREIYDELIAGGFNDEQIINVGKISAELIELQYFEKSIVKPSTNEVFVDAGCFDGETDLLFRNWCDGTYSKIYAFEPDSKNFSKCQETFSKEGLHNISLYPNGLWRENKTLHFNMQESQRSKVIENDEAIITVEGITLDEVVGNDSVTFIKMDIEGAELEALEGAKHTIKKNRPKLAISIYHKDRDILDIPSFILSLHEDYKLYIRHYSLGPEETILYAI